jgi:hypothetical protein
MTTNGIETWSCLSYGSELISRTKNEQPSAEAQLRYVAFHFGPGLHQPHIRSYDDGCLVLQKFGNCCNSENSKF